jgi:uncharacterized protein (DUF1330 family)
MKTQYTVALAVLAGVAVGGIAVQGLHAQAKPPVYVIGMIDVSNDEGYAKEYAPKATEIVKAAGGRLIARGGAGGGVQVTTLEGEPYKGRVVVQQWDSIDKVKAWHGSTAYKENRKIGDKYAKFRFIVLEGVPQ